MSKVEHLFFFFPVVVRWIILVENKKGGKRQRLTSSTVSGMHILYSFSNIAVGGYTCKWVVLILRSNLPHGVWLQLSKLAQLWVCGAKHANSPARGLCTKAEISKCLLTTFLLSRRKLVSSETEL